MSKSAAHRRNAGRPPSFSSSTAGHATWQATGGSGRTVISGPDRIVEHAHRLSIQPTISRCRPARQVTFKRIASPQLVQTRRCLRFSGLDGRTLASRRICSLLPSGIASKFGVGQLAGPRTG
ncbi:hypothetical protein [uncultured Zoogloea sp.]|uniref:hypothetical protein n=1 Tax=uncultured Zoogloea sp. TaxID=160237 RepID=UPI00260B9039|nr:hypothetical protein [uncultured Zoogloea sp.]